MIIVTGMHRSGTSLTAQVLQSLGANFGPANLLYDADRWNANGYLERVDAVDLNSRIITGHARTTSRGAAMLSQINYLRMPTGTRLHTRLDAAAEDIAVLGDSMRGLFVKDPRFCITAPAWLDSGSVDAMVVALRHPSASVASLRRRNRLPPAVGHRFWRWHMEHVLPLINPNTLVIQQEQLTGAGHTDDVARIRTWLREMASVETNDDSPTVLDRSLMHHLADDAGAPAESLELWDRLLAAPAWSPANPLA